MNSPISRSIEFMVPGKAVPKGRPRFSATGSPYTPTKTRAYEKMVGTLASIAMHGQAPMTGAVMVELLVVISPPTALPKKVRQLFMSGGIPAKTGSDGDNYAKAQLDGMNGIVFLDDVQVSDLTVRKRYGEEPHVLVRVSELSPPDFQG